MNSSVVELELNGMLYTGWKSFKITFDMESLSTAFDFELYDKGSTFSEAFQTGLEVSVYIKSTVTSRSKTLVATGYIVQINRSITGSATSMHIMCNDKLIDLVECSALHSAQTWYSKKFTGIIKDILKPFKISLDTSELQGDVLIKKFTLQSGETAFSAIERLCRSQAVLPLSLWEGVLKLGYAAGPQDKTVVNLAVGENILSFKEKTSWKERHSNYLGRSQAAGNGKRWTKAMLQCSANATDTGVTRYRPLLFVAENRADVKTLKKRVNWEAQVRSGRAREYLVSVDGFYQRGTQQLWQKNKRVNLRNTYWTIDTELLITKVAMSLTSSGELTVLTLKHPDIFKANPAERVKLA